MTNRKKRYQLSPSSFPLIKKRLSRIFSIPSIPNSLRYLYDGLGIDEIPLEAPGSLTVHSFENSVLNASIYFGEPYYFAGEIIDMTLNESDNPF